MEPSLKIENVELGKKLIEIKNNKVLVETPLRISDGATSLSINQTLLGFANGFLVLASLGPSSIALPSAASIISALGLKFGQQVQFPITIIGPNTCSVTAGSGIILVFGPYSLLGNSVNKFTLVCTGTSTLSLVL